MLRLVAHWQKQLPGWHPEAELQASPTVGRAGSPCFRRPFPTYDMEQLLRQTHFAACRVEMQLLTAVLQPITAWNQAQACAQVLKLSSIHSLNETPITVCMAFDIAWTASFLSSPQGKVLPDYQHNLPVQCIP